MPIGADHHIEYPANIIVRDVPMEQIGHRVYKYPPRLPPPQGHVQSLRPELEIEALLVSMALHTPEALCKRESIAMVAARANLGTARYRVPGRICPFDC